MPQGPAELHTKWQDCSLALQYLTHRGYTCDKGGVIHPPVAHVPTIEENSAIDYLFLEWDFGYEAK